MAATDLISVVLPAYRGAATIEAALKSIIGQTYPHWELLVMDDGSDDETAKLAEGIGDKRIKVFSDGHNRGIAARLNQGIALAQGAFVARMDADDLSFPRRFERQIDYLIRNPEVDLLATSVLLITAAAEPIGIVLSPEKHEEICRRSWLRFPMPHPTWMGRVEWFRRFPYDSNARKAQDQKLLYATFGSSRFAALTEPLLAYRYERVVLSKSYVGRLNFVRGVAEGGKVIPLVLSGALHAAALIRDAVAIAAGGHESVLLSRTVPADPLTLEAWESVRTLTARAVPTGANRLGEHHEAASTSSAT